MISDHRARSFARRLASAASFIPILAVAAGGCVADGGAESGLAAIETQHIRIGHWNIKELGTAKLLDPSEIAEDLSIEVNGARYAHQVVAMAQVLGRFRPDIVSINELQFDIENIPEQGLPGAPAGTMPGDACQGKNGRRLADRLHELNPELDYDYTVVAMGNSGMEFQTDEEVADNFKVRDDEFLGRYSFGLLSRYPILHDQVRVMHHLPWHELPGNSIEAIREDLGIVVPQGYWLFEKAVVIVPIDVNGSILYVVQLHPMTSGFHDMNPYRNHDELHALQLWLAGQLTMPGWEPLPTDAQFVLVGDWNVDPEDGDGDRTSLPQVLSSPRVVTHFPESDGGTKGQNPRRNTFLSGCGREDGTLPWNPQNKMELQLDYMLPSTSIGQPTASGIFWPTYPSGDWELACRASDHRFVWEDLDLPH